MTINGVGIYYVVRHNVI